MHTTEDGAVYTWGRGDDGRLGHGDNGWKYVPRIVEALEGQRIVQVGAVIPGPSLSLPLLNRISTYSSTPETPVGHRRGGFGRVSVETGRKGL